MLLPGVAGGLVAGVTADVPGADVAGAEAALWHAAQVVSSRPLWSAGRAGWGSVAWQPIQTVRPAWSDGIALGAPDELLAGNAVGPCEPVEAGPLDAPPTL